MIMLIGYARVSSEKQDTAIQQEQLEALQCEKLFMENVSGGSLDGREQLKKAIEICREGDTLIVMKLDRLARNVIDALSIAEQLKAKGVGLKIVDLDIDVNSTMGKLAFTMMAAIAEMEKSRIKQRCDEGRAKARVDGKHLGRPATANTKEIVKLRKEGLSMPKIAKLVECSLSTVKRALK